MQDSEFVEDYFSQFSEIDKNVVETNKYYFEGLLSSFREKSTVELRMWQDPNTDTESNCCLPLALISPKDRLSVTEYSSLSLERESLKNYDLVLCKMHAGLGTSVDRADHMKKYTSREKLGSKGTDLFVEIGGRAISLAELQFLQMNKIKSTGLFNSVEMLNMVNRETKKEVEKIQTKYPESAERLIVQLKVPTIAPDKTLTKNRTAPAGHGLVGFDLLLDVFKNKSKSELITIGNGEDLNSTADERILSWMATNEIPIAMITTTKIECDKKGGQISRCLLDDKHYFTIVERAQAEMADQLEYFEELGLRDSDHSSLFNTNIAVINTKVLKEKFNFLKGMEIEEFKKIITPTVIKNKKNQKGIDYIQLEGALGSVLLNLDRYFRLEHGTGLVHFLNLDPTEREEFFIPIKKFEDFEKLLDKYHYSEITGRFVKN